MSDNLSWPSLKLPGVLDQFLLLLICTVVIASLIPCRGEGAVIFGWLAHAAITLLFFLHGAKLSREAMMTGVGHWSLHVLVAASTFVLFPAIGLALRAIGGGRIDANMMAGVQRSSPSSL